MRMLQMATAAIARFFISAVFLAGAVKTVFNWHDTEKTLSSTLCDWQGYMHFSSHAQDCLTFLTPWSPLLLVIATLLLLVGGLLVLLGTHERLGAFFLLLFLIPTTILYHCFWFFEGAERDLQATMFLKNMAILGCLLLMILHGGRSKSDGANDFPSLNL